MRIKRVIIIAVIAVLAVGTVIGGAYIAQDYRRVITLSAEEVSQFDSYRLLLPEDISDCDAMDFFLEHCQIRSKDTSNPTTIIKYNYSYDNVSSFLPNCRRIDSVTQMDETLYISYLNSYHEEITLGYDRSGFESVGIYHIYRDEYILVIGDKAQKHTNVRHGWG